MSQSVHKHARFSKYKSGFIRGVIFRNKIEYSSAPKRDETFQTAKNSQNKFELHGVTEQTFRQQVRRSRLRCHHAASCCAKCCVFKYHMRQHCVIYKLMFKV